MLKVAGTQLKHKNVHILLAVIIFFLFVGSLEIVLRITHLFGARTSFTEPDLLISWRYTPRAEYWFNIENDHPITGRFNSYGYRDKEWFLRKRDDIYRIAILGDSLVEAFQVELEHTFIFLIEEKWNNSSRQPVIELMNFGRSAFSQAEERLVLERDVTQFNPDMVVLFFNPSNDIDDVSRETALDILRPFYLISENGKLLLDTRFAETREFKIKAYINRIKQRSAFISFIATRYNLFMRSKRKDKINLYNDPISGTIKGYLTLSTASPNPEWLRNYQINKGHGRILQEEKYQIYVGNK